MKIAISACLLGRNCRYNGEIKKNQELIDLLSKDELIPFCPEDYCYGTPRPSMDLINTNNEIKAVCNTTLKDLTPPLQDYANNFFNKHDDIELFIGKDRSPSCGVKSAKVYTTDKSLITINGTGIMAKEAIDRKIKAIDAEEYLKDNYEFSC